MELAEIGPVKRAVESGMLPGPILDAMERALEMEEGALRPRREEVVKIVCGLLATYLQNASSGKSAPWQSLSRDERWGMFEQVTGAAPVTRAVNAEPSSPILNWLSDRLRVAGAAQRPSGVEAVPLSA